MSYVRKKCALENARQKMRDKNFVAHFWARIFQRAFFTHIIHTRALRSLYFAEEMSSKSQKTAKLERKRYLPILRFSARRAPVSALFDEIPITLSYYVQKMLWLKN